MRTYTKSDLKKEINHLLEEEDRKVFKKDVDFIVDNLFNLIQEYVSEGNSVIINSFGKFTTTNVKSFTGRDPRNEEEVIVEPYKRVIFKTGLEFKRRVNGDEE